MVRKFKNENDFEVSIPALNLTVMPGDEFETPDDVNFTLTGIVEVTAKAKKRTVENTEK